jgi:hypothetical protein
VLLNLRAPLRFVELGGASRLNGGSESTRQVCGEATSPRWAGYIFAAGYLLRHFAVHEFAFPLVHQRPVDGAGAEVGHVEIRFQARERLFDLAVVFAEDGAVAGEQPLDVAGFDPLQRLDEVGDAAAVVGVDRADAAVAEQVVAREEQIAHAERELAVGVAGGVPYFELQAADADAVAIFDEVVDFHRRHFEVQVLGGDLGVGRELVAGFERLGGERVRSELGLEDLLGLGHALDVVDVGVRGDQRDALREGEVELADDFEALVDGVFVADVDQGPAAIIIVNQVDRAADAAAGLLVELDDVGEDGVALEHGAERGGAAAKID